MSLPGFNSPSSFTAILTRDKATYKPNKVQGLLDVIVSDITKVAQAVQQFNDDFATLNTDMCSNQWSGDAKTISQITEDIKAKLTDIGTKLVTHVAGKCGEVSAIDKKTADAVSGIKAGLQSNLDIISSINGR